VPAARHALARAGRRAGIAADRLTGIFLAVSEAVTNAVLHGYDAGGPGAVDVVMRRVAGHVEVVVSDHGPGMGPRPDSPGMGLGLPLISALADSVEVGRADGGGTRMCMRFTV
jgi:serine/threonine-protein kinase RsbW/stage II sporulation protein AB (anti-sigma F factor)